MLLLVAAAVVLRPKPSASTPAATPRTAPHARITVEVLNGTRRQGAARSATRVLRRQHLDVVFLGNADSLVGSTLIVARRGDSTRARYVAAALGMGAVRVETDTFRRVDVSVILGDDFRPPLDPHP
ncbi:MAG TPA: LytR C-terminal domain-containing protein [Gemmatimonadales bacterium]|nr:LytR C-terminal domain-containing protein [Gemmatimonadales bacterium]